MLLIIKYENFIITSICKLYIMIYSIINNESLYMYNSIYVYV